MEAGNSWLLVLLPMVTALLITVAIELVVALIMGFRKADELWAVVYVNIITNPLLNYFILMNREFRFIRMDFLILNLIEIAIVLVEWRLLVFALRQNSRRLLLLSFLMNLTSYVLGSFILR